MEVQEEVMARTSMDQGSVLKGKRTKRPRQMSPLVLTMATSSYSSEEGSGSGGGGYVDSGHNFSGVDRLTTSPSSNTGEFRQNTMDEEDMANCLILLAQGRSQKSSESVLAVNNKVAGAGTEVYQCKTCNRCFPSFQALGGHRASHKKPKVTLEEKKHVVLGNHHQENVQFNDDNTTLSLQIPSRDVTSPTNKSRVHECSICGAEFNSGQALGGHMRRHRPMPMVATTTIHDDSQEVKKPRTLLSLDLNLPAPEDDLHREPKFPFAPKEQVITFSASPLVDCHY